MIFSGKINIILPDNTKKITFQRNFFRKTIFSEYLEKENMVFRAVVPAAYSSVLDPLRESLAYRVLL